MKKKYNYYGNKLAVAVAAILLNAACTGFFEDYNTNQHEATEQMLSYDNLKTGAFFTQMQRNIVVFNEGMGDDGNLSSTYQVGQGHTSDIFAGYYTITGTWITGNLHNGCYVFVDDWREQLFTGGFVKVMPAWASIVKTANEQGLSEIAALATVVKVEAMHRVADTYGPIPYCNFGSGVLQNNYDGLDEVYAKFFEELDDAIDVLTDFVSGNPSAKIMAPYDVIYEGDAEKWVRFANTLRLRLAMRVVSANETLARTEAQKSLDNPIGFITTKNERASLKHALINYYHPLEEIRNFNAGEARMSAAMDAYMNGYQDPRRAAYFLPAASDGQYHGVRLGVTPTYVPNYVGAGISNLNFDRTSSEIVWMTAAESHFLRAEAALRWNIGGSAQSHYEAGITASFDETNAGDPTAYIASTNQPAAFTDAVGSNNQAQPSAITPKWDAGASFDANLERIITQKWIALYPDGPEGWAEFRRTGFPKLFPVVTNGSGGTVNTEKQARRLPYPLSEYNNNAAGVQTGIAKLGGADTGGTPLWWDKR